MFTKNAKTILSVKNTERLLVVTGVKVTLIL